MKGLRYKSTLILRFTKDAPHELRETEFQLAGETKPIKTRTIGTGNLKPDFVWGKSAMSLFHCLIRYAANPPSKGEEYTHPADNAELFATLCQTLKSPHDLNNVFGIIHLKTRASKVLTTKIFDAPNPTVRERVRIRSRFLPTEDIEVFFGEESKMCENANLVNCVKVSSKKELNDLLANIVEQFNDCPTKGKHKDKKLEEEDDLKNVVSVPRISEDLLKGLTPSLLECVKATRSRKLVSPEKDRPIFPGWKYNHFLGIGTVLLATSPATKHQPLLLWHHRQPRADGRIPEPLPGDSILFHASFTLKDPSWESPMDRWVNMEQIRQLSELEGEDCATLRQLFSYKIKIPREFKVTSHKMGVITRDYRKVLNHEDQKRRVYTQYVFLMILHIPDARTPKELQNIVVARCETPPGDPPVAPCFGQVQPEHFLTGRYRKPMDYLALRVLRGENGPITYEESQFTPTFKIL